MATKINNILGFTSTISSGKMGKHKGISPYCLRGLKIVEEEEKEDEIEENEDEVKEGRGECPPLPW